MSIDPIAVLFHVIQVVRNFFITLVHYIYWESINVTRGISDNLTCLAGKTAIVTGGNSGIGLMTAKLLASRGCKVIIACRRDAKKERDEIIEETQNENIIVKYLDLSKFASVRQFAEEIRKEETKIDVLINNAGVAFEKIVLTEDGFENRMQCNYFGHFLLTHLLIDLLRKSDDARVMFLTSALSILAEVKVEDLYPLQSSSAVVLVDIYSKSKLCNTLAAQEMAKKLDKYGIKVNAIDPGLVRTPIFDTLKVSARDVTIVRWIFDILIFFVSGDLNKSAQTSFHVAASKDVGTGLCYFRCVPVWKPFVLSNKDRCKEIWEETEKIVKLSPEERL